MTSRYAAAATTFGTRELWFDGRILQQLYHELKGVPRPLLFSIFQYSRIVFLHWVVNKVQLQIDYFVEFTFVDWKIPPSNFHSANNQLTFRRRTKVDNLARSHFNFIRRIKHEIRFSSSPRCHVVLWVSPNLLKQVTTFREQFVISRHLYSAESYHS